MIDDFANLSVHVSGMQRVIIVLTLILSQGLSEPDSDVKATTSRPRSIRPEYRLIEW